MKRETTRLIAEVCSSLFGCLIAEMFKPVRVPYCRGMLGCLLCVVGVNQNWCTDAYRTLRRSIHLKHSESDSNMVSISPRLSVCFVHVHGLSYDHSRAIAHEQKDKVANEGSTDYWRMGCVISAQSCPRLVPIVVDVAARVPASKFVGMPSAGLRRSARSYGAAHRCE